MKIERRIQNETELQQIMGFRAIGLRHAPEAVGDVRPLLTSRTFGSPTAVGIASAYLIYLPEPHPLLGLLAGVICLTILRGRGRTHD
jgi:hypothetical protein